MRAKQHRVTPRVSGPAAVAALLFLLTAGCGGAPQSAEPAPLAVEAVVPQVPGGGGGAGGAAGDAAKFPVRLVYDREATIALRLGGTLSAVPVRAGDRVAQGAVIAAITPTLFAAAEARAAADVARLERAARRNVTLLPEGAISEAQRDDTDSALAAARASLAAARYDRASTTARAPFAGVVLERLHEIGETVSPGEPVARLADTGSPLLARAAVAPSVAAGLAIGAAVPVTLAQGQKLVGTVMRKGSAADPASGTILIDIRLPAGTRLASGLTGSAALPANPLPSAAAGNPVLIPAEALVDADGARGHVFVVDPASSVARRTGVALHGFAGEALRVSGLPANARVITAGAGFVRDGQKVRVDGQ
ncbi:MULTISPECIES: efflux RND transporter periplasmic adaptor subunit [Novosphingobium]|uniref:efflux RND transporter periplasmic adaptor subunit n=1 Tax=Novosphingobium TaxID=165696 RepID=UPI0011AB65E6|nr:MULTISPECIES: efflux RND transporter periplasmic adaptor subunit [Novosphingobium]